MYAEHFGLAAEAFSLTPDPGFFFSGPDHVEALAGVKLAIEGRRGLAVVVGEVGTGKTTLLYSLLAGLGASVRTAYVANSRLDFTQLLRMALADFGVATDVHDKADLLLELNAFLQRCADEGATAALVIDEAQNLDPDAFEDFRLLSNCEAYHAKLLQIVLVGQPELEEKLADPRLRQVVDRVAVWCRIEPFGRADAERYVAHRIACAGGTPALFEPAAVRLVARASGGFPRRINMLCHDALLFAFARDAYRVTAQDVRGAIAQRARHAGTRRWPAWLARRPLSAAALAALVAAAAWSWQAPERSRAIAAAATAPGPIAHSASAVRSAVTTATIPTRGGAPRAAAESLEIRVRPGTHLTALARQYYGNDGAATLDGILRANPALANPDVLPVGSTLSLPATAGDSARKEFDHE